MKKGNNRYADDYYTRHARIDGYAARSVYKLMELQKAYAFMRLGQKVLDIGAAPGSWSQYCSEKVGDTGKVVSIDSTPFSLRGEYRNVTIIEGDFFSSAVQQELSTYTFHGVLSDLAPHTSGNKWVDSCSLTESVSEIITQLPQLLLENGFAIFKLFESAEVNELRQEMRTLFERCYIRKPSASRAQSKELYLVGFNYLHGKAIATSEQ